MKEWLIGRVVFAPTPQAPPAGMSLWAKNEARRLGLIEQPEPEQFPCGWDERDAKV